MESLPEDCPENDEPVGIATEVLLSKPFYGE